MPVKGQSLADFAAEDNATKAVAKCWMCGIPERAEVEHAIQSGKATGAQAVRWLKDKKGHADASIHRLRNHMANHVGTGTGPS